MYKIPLNELKTKKIRVKIVKPHQQVKHLLSTYVIDARKKRTSSVFYSSVEEAKRKQLNSWRKLEKAFKKHNKNI